MTYSQNNNQSLPGWDINLPAEYFASDLIGELEDSDINYEPEPQPKLELDCRCNSNPKAETGD